MPLVRDGFFETDPFVRIGVDWELPLDSSGLGDAIVPLDWLTDLAANWPNVGRIGVDVPNTVSLDQLEPHLGRLALVSIIFPAFSDGRGFSTAKALRNVGFRRILRANGPLIADQYGHALACGFDEIEIPEALALRQPETLWRAKGAAHLAYQRGYGDDANILDRRRAARVGGGHG